MPLPRNPGYGQVGDVIAAVLSKLDRISELLTITVENQEQEPDFDQTYVVGGNVTNGSVVNLQIPRGLRHVEISLSSSNGCAVLDDNLTGAQAQQRHPTGAGPSQSSAIVAVSGGAATARDYLGGSGYLTILFASTNTFFATVRIRSLDRQQQRAERT